MDNILNCSTSKYGNDGINNCCIIDAQNENDKKAIFRRLRRLKGKKTNSKEFQ